MKRIQLFEFEDFGWLPDPIRSSMTRLLIIFHRMAGSEKVVAGLLGQAIEKTGANRIVDLGSGAGGVMPGVVKAFNTSRTEKLPLLLTDLHPNKRAIRAFSGPEYEDIDYHTEPIDATRMDMVPGGLKTMIASFHHLPPAQAKAVLRGAAEQKQPLLIYEVAENKVPLLAWWIFLPLGLLVLFIMSLFMTLLVRPLTWQQLVFTYLIPVVPFCYAWDGQASLVRTYTFDDIRELIGQLDDHYEWEIAPALNAKGKKTGYYIFGYPVE